MEVVPLSDEDEGTGNDAMEIDLFRLVCIVSQWPLPADMVSFLPIPPLSMSMAMSPGALGSSGVFVLSYLI